LAIFEKQLGGRPKMRIHHFVIRLCLLAAFFLALPIAPATAQIGNTDVVGGAGGASDQDQCPDGALLTGMHFSGNKDINTVTPICTTYVNGQAASAPIVLRKWGTDYDPTYGFGGEPAKTPACPPNTAVEGITVEVSNVNLVHSFRFHCRNPLLHTYYDSLAASLGRGAKKYEKYVGCGGGAIAIGIVVHHGALIDALGLICKTWIVPAPVKPIKTTGKRKTSPTPSGPPVALRVTVGGAWKMQTVEGARTNLTLSPQGQGLSPFGQDSELMGMAGQIASPGGLASSTTGGLQGTFPPGRLLTFTYFRPDGATGTCQLVYSTDGQSLKGTCAEKGASFNWDGTRGSWPAP
jgi:hypothetical protein